MPRRALLRIVAAAVLLAVAACAAVDTTPPPSTPSPATELPAGLRETELEIADAVNERRRQHGLAPLESRDDLGAVARDYSQRMLEEGFFDHVAPDGSTVADRVLDAGIIFTAVGENLYLGDGPIDHVEVSVTGWMESPGHRENILREAFTQTGVGMARDGNDVRITQIFLTP